MRRARMYWSSAAQLSARSAGESPQRAVGREAEWPHTHGGLESLGATHPRMRFRGLNTSRHASSATSSTPAGAEG